MRLALERQPRQLLELVVAVVAVTVRVIMGQVPQAITEQVARVEICQALRIR